MGGGDPVLTRGRWAFPNGPPRQEVSVTYRAEYIWIDGTEPTPEIRSKTKIVPDGRRAGHLGLRRLEHQPGHRRQLRLRPRAGLHLSGPDPGRGQRPGDVRDLLTADLSPHPTNTRADGPGRLEKYGDQEPLFGLEQEYTMLDPASGWPYGFPSARLPRPPGPVLLRRRRGGDRRAGHRRGAHHPVHRGRPGDLRHQRRGHARPVGVPGRPGRHRGGRRPPLDGPLPPVPHRRELRRRRSRSRPSR